MKRKRLDCVEMKNRIQAQMFAEYCAHKSEFASFEDFVAAQVEASDWGRRMSQRFRRQQRSDGSVEP